MGVDLNGNSTYEDSETIAYDAIGNPTSYLGNDLLWTGRELYCYQNNNFRNTYYYDSEGLRSRKNMYVGNGNGGYTYNGKVMYQYLGGLLTYQCTYNAADEVDTEMYFFYDSYGKLTAIRYIKGTTNHYYYVTTNMQGDVLGIYSASGALLASYDYDAWGNCTVDIKNSNYTIGNDNPIRYRSYYYDIDTGLYYLQSRYYNSEIGRFLNADSTLNGNGDILGYNMFAYCSNNPVMFSDPTGHFIVGIAYCIAGFVIAGALFAGMVAGIYTLAMHCQNAQNEKQINNEIKETYTQDEAKAEIDGILGNYGDSNISFNDDKNSAEIKNSYLIKSKYERQKISMIISRTDNLTNRDYDNISAEWNYHNFMYYVPIENDWYEENIRGSATSATIDYVVDPRPVKVVFPTKAFEILGWD